MTQHVAPALDAGQGFTMAWRDLVVVVATESKRADGGLAGTIDRGTIVVAGLDDRPPY
ncbi:MAG: hypothetical protein R2867_16110 [Caldilineaceae bacterium]